MADASAYKACLAVIELLAETYPHCFAVFQGRRKPLKLRIHHDILTALNGTITPRECANAMRWYTGNVGYLRACVEGAPRVDLNGEAAGAVSAEEADNAKQRLQQRRRSNGARPRPIAQVDTTPIKPRLSLAGLREAAQARRQHANRP